MPQLLEQKNYQQELKPLLVRSISSLIPSLTEVEVLRRQLMVDIQTLVEADESYRKLLITELSALDRSWSFINNKPGRNPDQKQIRVGLQIKHEASIERFRPIIMTTLTALMGRFQLRWDLAQTALRVNRWA